MGSSQLMPWMYTCPFDTPRCQPMVLSSANYISNSVTEVSDVTFSPVDLTYGCSPWTVVVSGDHTHTDVVNQ